jgi:hypothetical protein
MGKSNFDFRKSRCGFVVEVNASAHWYGSLDADCSKTTDTKATFSANWWPPRTRAEGGLVEPVLGAPVSLDYWRL